MRALNSRVAGNPHDPALALTPRAGGHSTHVWLVGQSATRQTESALVRREAFRVVFRGVDELLVGVAAFLALVARGVVVG
jgi:hypothetical protein